MTGFEYLMFGELEAGQAELLAADLIKYGQAWSRGGKRIDPITVYADPVPYELTLTGRALLEAGK